MAQGTLHRVVTTLSLAGFTGLVMVTPCPGDAVAGNERIIRFDADRNGIPDTYERSPYGDFLVLRGAPPAGVRMFVFPQPEPGRPITVAVLHPATVRVLRMKVEPGDADPLMVELPTRDARGTFVDFDLPAEVPGDSVRITVELEGATLLQTTAMRPPGSTPEVYVDELPQVVKKVRPDYPAEAMRRGISGTVMVQALVGKDGIVKDVKIVRSVPGLDEAAEACVWKWKFKPARSRGKPVTVWVAMPVRFSL